MNLSFQRPHKIADGMRLIAETKPRGLWDCLVDAMVKPVARGKRGEDEANALKDHLDVIVLRRNAVVHEEDALDSVGTRSPIDAAAVSEALDFLSV